MTREDHLNGSSRIFEALERLDPKGRHDVIVNLQGDLPTIDPRAIATAVEPLADPRVDIATLACVITREEERADPSVVKAVGSELSRRRACGRSISRAPPLRAGRGRSSTMSGFMPIGAPRSSAMWRCRPRRSKSREKLEQLRALEAGMRIDIMLVDDVPLGVDTPQDLDRARAVLERRAACRREPVTAKIISYQGEPGANSHIACEEVHPGWEPLPSPDLRGRLRGGHRRRGLARHDSDREFGRRTRRRHPSSLASLGAAHRRRALPADPLPALRAEGREL